VSFNATPENLSANVSKATLSIKNLSGDIGSSVSNVMMGSFQYSGLLLMVLAMFGLWKADVDIDIYGPLLVGFGMLLGRFGALPGSQGVLFGVVVGVAGVGAMGVIRFINK